MEERFEKQLKMLKLRKAENALRVLTINEGLVDFSSNDYLGIASDGNYVHGSTKIGSGGSRLLSGNYKEIENLESFIAKFHQAESALIFNSGYNANVGFFSAVPQKGDTVLYDELIHASIKDGMRLSFAKSYSFKHNDLSDLEKKLKHASGDIYVVVEGVYSMDGDAAPISELVLFCKTYNLILVVDEAHSLGVFGEKGEGLVQSLGMAQEVPIRIVTYGKAAGVHGAAILGNNTIKQFLVNFCRAFIYTTALPPSSINALFYAYREIEKGERTKALRQVISFYKDEISTLNQIQKTPSDSAIQTVLIPGNNKVKSVSNYLTKNGFDVRPVMSPTVKKGTERIRICLHANNTKVEIVNLINSLKTALID